MEQVYELERAHSPVALSWPSSAKGLTTLLLIVFFACFSIYMQEPPAAASASAPLTQFSSGRAMAHLQMIAPKPHPIGSAQQAEVRSYIIKELSEMGLEPTVQRTSVVNQTRAGTLTAATVQNIVAKLSGTESSKAVLLAGHYDSVPNGPGASDDGSAVAAMLETLRALRAGASLKNDVIVLFTDGEEVGLLGAKAFVDEHPWAKEVGLVLNFEARGNGGPSFMFETSEKNGWLIKEFAKAAPHPAANSLSYDIYKMLPNDTDMTIFKESGLPGLNFAYIRGIVYYHSSTDSIGNIDERSLQHQGSYMLGLTRHFGDLNLVDKRESDAVYFNVLGSSFVEYSGVWVTPLVALVSLLFAGVIILGFKTRRLTWSGVGLGFLAFLISMIVAPIIVTIAWKLILMLHSGYTRIPQGDTYNSNLYMVGFATLAVALTSIVYVLFLKKVSVENLAAGALLWWLILMMLSARYLPGGNYLFTWPLLFSLIALGYLFLSKDQASSASKRFAVLSFSAIPGIILFVPIIYQVFVALTLSASGIVMIMLVLVMGLLIPHLHIMATPKRWLLPGLSAVISFGFIVAGSLTSGFDVEHPRPDSIFYALDADTGKAVWASSDNKSDEWTSQFLPDSEREALSTFFPLGSRKYLKSQAPAVTLQAPNVVLMNDEMTADVRTLLMRIVSPRQASAISIYVESAAESVGASIDGKQIKSSSIRQQSQPGSRWALNYYAVPQEGVELTLRMQSSQSVKIRLVDRSYELPIASQLSFTPRPGYIMPAPFSSSDSTFVTRSFAF